MESVKDKIERKRHHKGGKPHENGFLSANTIDPYLGFIAVIGVSEPRHEGNHSHGHCHTEVGDHLAVVGKGEGNDAVENTEKDHEHLPDWVPLCVKNEGRDTDKGGEKGGVILAIKEAEGNDNEPDGRKPKGDLLPCEVFRDRVSHTSSVDNKFFSKKSIRDTSSKT